jgi:hypothetical protein
MNKRATPFIIILSLFSLIIAASCSTSPDIQVGPTLTDSPKQANETSSHKLRTYDITKEQWDNETFTLAGTASLINGTVCETQLYNVDQPVAWWPVSQDITVEWSHWQVTVNIPAGQAPDSVAGYSLKIWRKNNPGTAEMIPLMWSVPPPIPMNSSLSKPSPS